jgi:hypothetical protein
VEVCKKRIHLLLAEAAGEGWHIALAGEDSADDLRIGGGRAAGQRGAAEKIAQARRRRLEGEIVLFVAMGTTYLIEVLARGLLGREPGLGVAASEDES